MQCPSCGRDNPEESLFCTYCGRKIRPDADLGSHAFDEDRRDLKAAIAAGKSVGREIPPWLVIIPYVLYIVTVFIAVIAVFSMVFDYFERNSNADVDDLLDLMDDSGGIIALMLIGPIILYTSFGILTYVLIKRANEHFRRENRTREVISSMIGKVDRMFMNSDRSHLRWPDVMAGQMGLSQDRMRNPFVWALVIMIPLFYTAVEIAVLATGDFEDLAHGGYTALNYLLSILHVILLFYLLHFLTQDMNEHDMRWSEFARQVKVSLARSGFVAGGMYSGRLLERRSTALYIVLSIVTVGIFVVFWWYSIVKDHNDHFRKQAYFESEFQKFVEDQVKRSSPEAA